MLQLAVKAGSVDETDAQQGLAHFLEHMGFNGTKRFKPGELIAALESTGARLGPHVNAQTGFDDTIYMFQLPTDKAGIVEKGMQALADFAGGMTLDAEGDRQGTRRRDRGVARWARRWFAAARSADPRALCQVEVRRPAAHRQARRCSRRFLASELRAFYSKWYRPDRMAVVAVGDMPAAELEALIKKEFGQLAEAGDAGAGARLSAAAAVGSAGQDGDRRRGHAVLGLHRQEAAAGAAGQGQRLSPQPRRLTRLPDAERPVRRDLAQGGCAVPERGRVRGRADPDGRYLHARGERAGRQDRARAGGARSGSQPGRAVWLRRRGAGSGAQVDAREL